MTISEKHNFASSNRIASWTVFALLLLLFDGLSLVGWRTISLAHAQPKRLIEEGQHALQLYNSGNYQEALDRLTKVINQFEARFGRDSHNFTLALYTMAKSHEALGDWGKAESLYRRTIDIVKRTKGINHFDVLDHLVGLASVYYKAARYHDAQPLMLQALAITAKQFGELHFNTASRIVDLANTNRNLGRHRDASRLFQRALRIYEKIRGSEDPSVARVLNDLAATYEGMGYLLHAEALYKRALEIRHKTIGADTAGFATSLNNLAVVYIKLNRLVEAQELGNRALAIWKKVFDPDHYALAVAFSNLAQVHMAAQRLPEAKTLYERSLTIMEKYGPHRPEVAAALNNLGVLYSRLGDEKEAESFHRKALAIRERGSGPDHPSTAESRYNLARSYIATHRYDEAENLLKRTLPVVSAAFGANSIHVAPYLDGLAELSVARGNIFDSLTYSRSAARIVADSTADRPATGGDLNRNELSFVSSMRRIKTLYKAREEGLVGAEAGFEALEVAQSMNRTSTSVAVDQMNARFHLNSNRIAILIRQQQDAGREVEALDRILMSEYLKPPSQERVAQTNAIQDNIKKLFKRRQELESRIKVEFPRYSSFIKPSFGEPSELGSTMAPSTAMIVFSGNEKGMFVWVVTNRRFEWRMVDTAAQVPGWMERILRPLRPYQTKSMDVVSFTRDEVPLSRGLAEEDKSMAAGPNRESKEFDLAASYGLYKALFGPIEDLIKDKKHLIIVADGALTSLPFQVLVKAAPTSNATYKTAHWLIRDHAVSVLPSVSSLKALRGVPRGAATASLPFIGFGDPLIGNDVGAAFCSGYEQDDLRDKPAGIAERITRVPAVEGAMFWGGGFTDEGIAIADVEWLRRQARLVDSRCEVEAMARLLGTGSAIYVGEHATEAKVKELSTKGELKKYRVLAFATHGLLPKQAKGVVEAGLILTPPEKGSADDDGLLTASEVAGLDLDADWVILSACNTASGDEPGAATLSGLARAFFYAGARSLLVSHWPIDSRAAVLLTTRTLRAMEQDPTLGKAGALRQAMLSFLAQDVPEAWSDPRIWAPFSLVGEGGR